jgi:hypothetical protein
MSDAATLIVPRNGLLLRMGTSSTRVFCRLVRMIFDKIHKIGEVKMTLAAPLR